MNVSCYQQIYCCAHNGLGAENQLVLLVPVRGGPARQLLINQSVRYISHYFVHLFVHFIGTSLLPGYHSSYVELSV